MGVIVNDVETVTRAIEYIILEGLMSSSSHIAITSGQTRANVAVMDGMNCPRMKVTIT